MTGTFLNIFTVLLGGTLGMLFGARLPERVRQTVVAGLGLFTGIYGIRIALGMEEPLVVLGSLLIGGIAGEWLQIEAGLSQIGSWLEKRFTREDAAEDGETDATPGGSRFIRGFLTASLLYCVGPMTILGAIQDGLQGDFSLLAIKSVLDGFASLAFASSLGIGVLFSVLVIFVYQGGISLLAAQAEALITEQMMTEMTAVGGVLLLGIALSSLLEIKPIRVGNFLPALIIAPLIVAILALLGITN